MRIQVGVIDKGLFPRQYLLVNIWNVVEWGASDTTLALMRTQLFSYRLPNADSALLRSSLFHHLCRFVSFRQVD